MRFIPSYCFTTSYCNQPHDMRDGVPIEHNCYVIPVKALKLECDGDITGAQELISTWRNRREHRGRKRPSPALVTVYGYALVKCTVQIDARLKGAKRSKEANHAALDTDIKEWTVVNVEEIHGTGNPNE